MNDEPITFGAPVQDNGLNSAFNSSRADRGGRHSTRVTADPDAARLLPPFVTAPPRRVVPRAACGQADAAAPTTD